MNTNKQFNAIPTVPLKFEFSTRYGTFSFVLMLWADGTVRSQDVLNDAAEQAMQLGRHELDTISRNVDTLLHGNDNVRSLTETWLVQEQFDINFVAVTGRLTIQVILSHGDAAKKGETIHKVTASLHAIADNAIHTIVDVLRRDSLERANTINWQASNGRCKFCGESHGALTSSDLERYNKLFELLLDGMASDPKDEHNPTTYQHNRYTRITDPDLHIIRKNPYRTDLGEPNYGFGFNLGG